MTVGGKCEGSGKSQHKSPRQKKGQQHTGKEWDIKSRLARDQQVGNFRPGVEDLIF
jgi:hypothetical protein